MILPRFGSGLDYADQRYYTPGSGRFMTADPYEASAGAGDPGSWNRYSYVQGDPVNLTDPTGLYAEEPDASAPWGFSGGLGFGDPFEGLGSGAYNDWTRPRRLACLSPACIYWSIDSDGRGTAAGLAVGSTFIDASTAGTAGKLAIGFCAVVPEICIAGVVAVGGGILVGEGIHQVLSRAATAGLCVAQACEMDPKDPHAKPPGEGWSKDDSGDWTRNNPDGTTEKIHPDFQNRYGEAPHWDWNIYTPPGKGGSTGWKIWTDGKVTPAGNPMAEGDAEMRKRMMLGSSANHYVRYVASTRFGLGSALCLNLEFAVGNVVAYLPDGMSNLAIEHYAWGYLGTDVECDHMLNDIGNTLLASDELCLIVPAGRASTANLPEWLPFFDAEPQHQGHDLERYIFLGREYLCSLDHLGQFEAVQSAFGLGLSNPEFGIIAKKPATTHIPRGATVSSAAVRDLAACSSDVFVGAYDNLCLLNWKHG